MALRRRKSSDIPARSRVVVVYAVVDDALSPGVPARWLACRRERSPPRPLDLRSGLADVWPGRGRRVNTAQQRRERCGWRGLPPPETLD